MASYQEDRRISPDTGFGKTPQNGAILASELPQVADKPLRGKDQNVKGPQLLQQLFNAGNQPIDDYVGPENSFLDGVFLPTVYTKNKSIRSAQRSEQKDALKNLLYAKYSGLADESLVNAMIDTEVMIHKRKTTKDFPILRISRTLAEVTSYDSATISSVMKAAIQSGIFHTGSYVPENGRNAIRTLDKSSLLALVGLVHAIGRTSDFSPQSLTIAYIQDLREQVDIPEIAESLHDPKTQVRSKEHVRPTIDIVAIQDTYASIPNDSLREAVVQSEIRDQQRADAYPAFLTGVARRLERIGVEGKLARHVMKYAVKNGIIETITMTPEGKKNQRRLVDHDAFFALVALCHTYQSAQNEGGKNPGIDKDLIAITRNRLGDNQLSASLHDPVEEKRNEISRREKKEKPIILLDTQSYNSLDNDQIWQHMKGFGTFVNSKISEGGFRIPARRASVESLITEFVGLDNPDVMRKFFWFVYDKALGNPDAEKKKRMRLDAPDIDAIGAMTFGLAETVASSKKRIPWQRHLDSVIDVLHGHSIAGRLQNGVVTGTECMTPRRQEQGHTEDKPRVVHAALVFDTRQHVANGHKPDGTAIYPPEPVPTRRISHPRVDYRSHATSYDEPKRRSDDMPSMPRGSDLWIPVIQEEVSIPLPHPVLSEEERALLERLVETQGVAVRGIPKVPGELIKVLIQPWGVAELEQLGRNLRRKDQDSALSSNDIHYVASQAVRFIAAFAHDEVLTQFKLIPSELRIIDFRPDLKIVTDYLKRKQPPQGPQLNLAMPYTALLNKVNTIR